MKKNNEGRLISEPGTLLPPPTGFERRLGRHTLIDESGNNQSNVSEGAWAHRQSHDTFQAGDLLWAIPGKLFHAAIYTGRCWQLA